MNPKNLYLSAFIITSALFAGCGNKQLNSNDIKEDDFIVQFMDSSVSPGEDFFKFATGTWMKQNPIPASEKRYGIANLVRDDIYEKLLSLNKDAVANTQAAKGSNTQKIGDFWVTAMDTNAINSQGIKPLQPAFDKINAIKTKDDVVSLISEFQLYAGSPLYSPAIYQDEMNSEKYAVHFYQGGIGLPERDYYFNNDSRTRRIRDEYQSHVSKMFRLMGDDEKKANDAAAVIMRMETELAKASRKLEDLRDPYANYNKMTVDEFTKLTPSIRWKELFAKMNLKDIDTVIVGQPEFFKQAEQSIKSNSIENWKTYLRWNLINAFASELSKDFDQQNFYFYGTILSGAKEQRPRWKRMIDMEENFLGDALGQLYVDKYVSPAMKDRYTKLVDNMLEAYKTRITKLDWMSPVTKEKAIDKLSKITAKVCYPEKWKDYSTMNIDRSSFINNVISCRIWQYNYYVSKLYKPVDRDEWEMTPQTYNAYYNPSNNEIVLPAAQFLIPGLPDSLADDAIIYGYAAASTIGHELTHGFDDQGRQFDAKGNLTNWWTSEDSARFAQRAQMLEKQFSNYVVLDSLHINGKATLGENIADLGGLVIGLEAFKKTDQYKKGEKRDGLTPLQRYFLGYTLGWLGHTRDESLAMQVMTNVHSPNFLRVNGPFSDLPEFYEAFGVKPGDKMYLPDSLRVSIW